MMLGALCGRPGEGDPAEPRTAHGARASPQAAVVSPCVSGLLFLHPLRVSVCGDKKRKRPCQMAWRSDDSALVRRWTGCQYPKMCTGELLEIMIHK